MSASWCLRSQQTVSLTTSRGMYYLCFRTCARFLYLHSFPSNIYYILVSLLRSVPCMRNAYHQVPIVECTPENEARFDKPVLNGTRVDARVILLMLEKVSSSNRPVKGEHGDRQKKGSAQCRWRMRTPGFLHGDRKSVV